MRSSGPEPQSLQVGSEIRRNVQVSDSRPWQFTSSRIIVMLRLVTRGEAATDGYR